MNVAFIPARAGSRGIPGKNKKNFCGKPLVQWSIDAAKDSKLFDKIIVSSDDPDIIGIAKKCGVAFDERLPELARDETKLDDVMLEYFSRPGNECDYISLLQPTSPLRSMMDLKKSFKFIEQKQWWSVVGVTWNPVMGWVDNISKKGAGCLYLIHDRPNRQNRDNFYLENGAIYWVRYNVLLNQRNRIGAPTKCKIFPMPPERSVELDSPFDWFIAEKTFEWLYRPKYRCMN